MKISDRIHQAERAAVERGELDATRTRAAEPAVIDGLADFKSKVHAALFARLGQRLFDTTDESQLHSIVVGEITALMAADERPLSRAERQALPGTPGVPLHVSGASPSLVGVNIATSEVVGPSTDARCERSPPSDQPAKVYVRSPMSAMWSC